jgi:ankyrin repeat protein
MRWQHPELGTLLQRAIFLRASGEKLRRLLRVGRGARKAFFIRNAQGNYPLHVAATTMNEGALMQILLDNGGRAAVNLQNGDGRRASEIAQNDAVRAALQAAEQAIAELPVNPPAVEEFRVEREDNDIAAFIALNNGLTPIPPEMPWVPLQGDVAQVRAEYINNYNRIQLGFSEGTPFETFLSRLNTPWLQQERNGERRIQKLMRFKYPGGRQTTLLKRALEQQASTEKIRELLRPERGGQRAFFIPDGNGEYPLDFAASRYRDENFIRFLIQNGGRAAVNLVNGQNRRPRDRALNNRVRNVLLEAEQAIAGQPAPPPVEVFEVHREVAIQVAVPGAVPAAAVPEAAVPAAAVPEAPIPEEFGPIPPPQPFVPIEGPVEAVRQYNARFDSIWNAIKNSNLSFQAFNELLNEPWLQEQVNGVRRIQNLMKVSGPSGTILHIALYAHSNGTAYHKKLLERKIKEILRPERGGQDAFRIRDTTPASGSTATHIAALRVTNVEFLRYLLDNGGRQGLNVVDNNGLKPVERNLGDQNLPIIVEAMAGAPDGIPLDKFTALEPEVPGPMEVGGPVPVGPAGLPYKGYTKEDVTVFNTLFEEPSEYVLCPVCLQYTRRGDGCMYLHGHNCKKEDRNERLYQIYKQQYGGRTEIMMCTVCGRVCADDGQGRHRHFVLTVGTETERPAFAPMVGGYQPFGNDCSKNAPDKPPGNQGGGGVVEKIHRFQRLLNYACELQEDVGRKTQKEVKTDLVEQVWRAPFMKIRDPQAILSKREFKYPCAFPVEEAAAAPAAPVGFPDIASPNPVPTPTEDKKCFINTNFEDTFGDPHEDNRPTFTMPHKVGEEIKDHGGQHICAADLVGALQAGEYKGTCPFDPPCEGLVHPVDIKPIIETLTQEMIPGGGDLETYKKTIYESFYTKFYETHPEFRVAAAAPANGQAGGAERVSLLSPMMDGFCEVPPATGARRNTYRKKQKGKTQKRRVR